MKKTLKQGIPILLALLLLAYVLRGMPLTSLLSQLRRASGAWIAVTALVMGTQTILRAMRWRMLLRGLGYSPSTDRAMSAMLAGSASGLLVPGSGELLRCTLLQRSDNVPITESVGSIITERLVDLLMTAIFLVIALLVGSSHLLTYAQTYLRLPAWPSVSPNTLWLGAGIVFIVGTLAGWGVWQLARRGTLTRLHTHLRLRERLAGFRRGLFSIRQVTSPMLYWLTTALIHSLSLVVLYALFQALPITKAVPTSAALTIFALTSLGSLTIPTQASIGSYHFFASRGLLAYGVPLLSSTVWATFSHAVITLVNLFFSALGFLAALRFLRQKSVVSEPVNVPETP